MVKTYLRYSLESSVGIVSSCNSIFTDSSCKFVASGSLQSISVWNVKQAERIKFMPEEEKTGDKNVTVLARSPDGKHIAAGYDDGAVKMWGIDNGALVLTLNGHRSAVTCLAFNSTGSILASGAKDTDIIGIM